MGKDKHNVEITATWHGAPPNRTLTNLAMRHHIETPVGGGGPIDDASGLTGQAIALTIKAAAAQGEGPLDLCLGDAAQVGQTVSAWWLDASRALLDDDGTTGRSHLLDALIAELV